MTSSLLFDLFVRMIPSFRRQSRATSPCVSEADEPAASRYETFLIGHSDTDARSYYERRHWLSRDV